VTSPTRGAVRLANSQRAAVYDHAAAALETAIAEMAFHFVAFAREGADPPRTEGSRVLVGAVTAAFDDVAALSAAQRGGILAPHSYAAFQGCAKEIRAGGANGVAYPSVRHAGG